MVLLYGEHRRELSAGFARTTNNRMELLAVIEGLKALRESCKVDIYSDSQYVVNGIKKGWAEKWKKNNWMRNRFEEALNADLWGALLNECAKHDVNLKWVRGHAGNRENERCDKLAKSAADKKDLPVDSGFNKSGKKKKVEKEGDPCPICGKPVIKKFPRIRKAGYKRDYYYQFYFYCPDCSKKYKTEDGKIFLTAK